MANFSWGRGLRAGTIVLVSGSHWFSAGQSPAVRGLVSGLFIGLAITTSEWSISRELSRSATAPAPVPTDPG